MGCAQSRVDNEEAVSRCKERRQWIKTAVAARSAFAAAHSAYSVALKNSGAALSDFALSQSPSSSTAAVPVATSTADAAAAPPPPPPHDDTLPPPPPPLPEFSPVSVPRSMSMPPTNTPSPLGRNRFDDANGEGFGDVSGHIKSFGDAARHGEGFDDVTEQSESFDDVVRRGKGFGDTVVRNKGFGEVTRRGDRLDDVNGRGKGFGDVGGRSKGFGDVSGQGEGFGDSSGRKSDGFVDASDDVEEPEVEPMRLRRRPRRSTGGGGGTTKETVTETPPPPMPEPMPESWDYFFAMDESMSRGELHEIREETTVRRFDRLVAPKPGVDRVFVADGGVEEKVVTTVRRMDRAVTPMPPAADRVFVVPGGGDGNGERIMRMEHRLDRARMPSSNADEVFVEEGDEEDEEPVTPKKVVVEEELAARAMQVRKKKIGGNVNGNVNLHHQHAALASAVLDTTRKGKMVEGEQQQMGVSLLQVLVDIDDHFLKASQSAHEVSKMLEATRMHYHSNFADNRGHIDHSARVMRVITWNRSFKGIPNAEDKKDDFDDDEWETHATVLDKMLAWEKKLFDEVKAGELMKIEYQRKVALLNRQKKRGVSNETLERTKAAVSHLHTRYIVDMQSMDSTVSEIQHLRDKQLYPRLVELIDGMAKMWQAMYFHHDEQLKIAVRFKEVEILDAPKETSEHHYRQTEQLCKIVNEWQTQFHNLVSHQKEYIHALNSWLKLNLIPIESSLKEKVSSPPRPVHAPIQALLHAWNDSLEKLPEDIAKSAILSFAAVISNILSLQQEERKQKEKCEEAHKEYLKKNRAFDDWYQKFAQKRAGLFNETMPEGGDGTNSKDPVSERKFIVESLKSKLDEELDNHKNISKQVREKALSSLRTHLPELFRAISDFAHASADMYSKLKLIPSAESAN